MGGRSGVSSTRDGTKGTSVASKRSAAGTCALTRAIAGRQAAAPRHAARLQCAFAQGSSAGACCIASMWSHGMSIAMAGTAGAGMLAIASSAATTGATTPARLIDATRTRCNATRVSFRSDMGRILRPPAQGAMCRGGSQEADRLGIVARFVGLLVPPQSTSGLTGAAGCVVAAGAVATRGAFRFAASSAAAAAGVYQIGEV